MERGNGDDEAEESEAVYGSDVHRDFALVAIWQDGVMERAGRFGTTPEQVRAFADNPTSTDEVALEATGKRVGNRHGAGQPVPRVDDSLKLTL